MSTLIVSQRGVKGTLPRQLGFGAWLEAEQVLVDAGGADLLRSPVHGLSPSVRLRRLAGRRLRQSYGPDAVLPGRFRVPPLIDHLIFIPRSPWDLPIIERLTRGRKPAICVSIWLPEVWPSELEDDRLSLEAYGMVDQVFVGVPQSIDGISALAPGSDVHYLPTAVDVVRFAGSPRPRTRPAAVIGIGRRSADQHRVLLDWCEANDALYLYDTIEGHAADWRTHRRSMADWYRRSSVAICNYGKHDQPELIGDLRPLPARLFEGLAAGCHLIGSAPDAEDQVATLGRTVVTDVAVDDLPGMLDRLVGSTDPRARIDNIALAARGHDWGHRWDRLFRLSDRPVPPGIERRLEQLARMADDLYEPAELY